MRSPDNHFASISLLTLAVLCGGLVVFGGCSASDDMSLPALDVAGQAPPPTVAAPDTEEPQDDPGDRYEAPATNPFVIAAHDPKSSFAADVDTASYDIFRRDIERGTLPHKDSVRLEEYVNSFKYGYVAPEPTTEEPFSITLRGSRSPFSKTTLLAVGVQGKVLPKEEKRPANLVFLIDTSGSMSSSTKLPLVKALLLETIEVLDETDTLSIVTYAGSTAVRLTPTPVSERGAISSIINALGAGGSTAGAAGIQLAYEQAADGFIEGGINHVLLCTDGDFNVGISDTSSLVKLIEEKRKTGITLTALGFGFGNLNDAMMEAVTNAGNGIYSVISSEDQVIKYANERLFSTFVHIAKDVKIQVEFNPNTVLAHRLLGYENRRLTHEEFVDDRKDAGEVGSGHSVTALYELVMVGETIPTPVGAPEPLDGETAAELTPMGIDEIALVRVRYKHPGATELDPADQVDTVIAQQSVTGSLTAADTDLQWAAAMAAFAEILKQSPYAHPDKLDQLESLFEGSASSSDTDADRLEFMQLFAEAKGRLLTGAQ